MSPQLSPPAELATARDELLAQYLIDAMRTLDRLDDDLAHGNVLAARSVSLTLRTQVRMLERALNR